LLKRRALSDDSTRTNDRVLSSTQGNRNRFLIVVIFVVILAVAVAGAVYYYSTTVTPPPSLTIRIGTTFGAADTSDIPSVYAGTVLMKQAGYTVNYVILTGQQAGLAALLTGEIDVFQSSPIGPVAAYAKGNPNIVAFGAAEDASDELMVCTSNVTSVPQFATQHVTVAVTSFTDSSYYYPYVWLKQNGYDPTQVNWVFVPGAAGRGAALLSGRIPCGATDPGSTVVLLSQPGNKFHVVATLASELPTMPLNLLFTTRAYLASHRDALVALLIADISGNRWAQNKQAYLQFAPTVIGSQLSPDDVSKAYDILVTLGIWNVNSVWNATVGNTIANLMGQFKLGGVTSTPDPAGWADYSLYQQAIGQVGTQ
jgi:hypothetical protein